MRALPRPGAALERPVRLVWLALAVAACAPAQATAASPLLTTEPSLRPGFKQAVNDYVVHCPDRSLTVAVREESETKVTVDGRRTREERTVAIEEGQAVPIIVRQRGLVTRHFVRCLPDDFHRWRYRRFGPQTPRWYFLTPGPNFVKPSNGFSVIFDHHGVPVWWLRPPKGVVHNLGLVDGNIGYAEAGGQGGGINTDPSKVIRIIRPDGSLVRSIETVDSPTDFHDFEQLGRDDLVLTYRQRPHVDLTPYGGPEDATVLDSEIQRIDRDGQVVWSWSSRDHIDFAETVVRPGALTGTQIPDGSTVYDMTHINSVEPAGRNDLIISLRNTDAVYRISMSDGHIRWKLGGTETPESLRVVGKHADQPFGYQHDARLWRGTVTVFDNGTDLGSDASGRPPRAVRYEIDTNRRRAILREEIRDPRLRGESLCCGNARKLGNGDWVVGWGGGPSAAMSVLTPRGRVISRLTIGGGFFSYRAVPVRAGAISAARLRAGMDALYAAGEAD